MKARTRRDDWHSSLYSVAEMDKMKGMSSFFDKMWFCLKYLGENLYLDYKGLSWATEQRDPSGLCRHHVTKIRGRRGLWGICMRSFKDSSKLGVLRGLLAVIFSQGLGTSGLRNGRIWSHWLPGLVSSMNSATELHSGFFSPWMSKVSQRRLEKVWVLHLLLFRGQFWIGMSLTHNGYRFNRSFIMFISERCY